MRFVGRAAELQVLHDAWGSACERRTVVALVEGPPGIGKTSPVERFLRDLESGRILRASGDEVEQDVSLVDVSGSDAAHAASAWGPGSWRVILSMAVSRLARVNVHSNGR